MQSVVRQRDDLHLRPAQPVAGHEHQRGAGVGLYGYKARLYSPTLGRFMQTDPVGYKDGMNWYDYVHNDPINNADPAGTCAITDSDSPCPPTDGAIAAYEAKVSSAQVGDGSYSSSGVTNGFSSSNSKASNASSAQQNSGTQFAQTFPLPPLLASPDIELDPFLESLMQELESMGKILGPERGLPPDGVEPPTTGPFRPGPATRPSEVGKGGKSLYDPRGGGWRWFPGDKYHNPNWDYNSGSKNAPWENIEWNGLLHLIT